MLDCDCGHSHCAQCRTNHDDDYGVCDYCGDENVHIVYFHDLDTVACADCVSVAQQEQKHREAHLFPEYR